MLLASGLRAKGVSPNSLGGPGSILCSFPGPTETNYGYLFLIEFVGGQQPPDPVQLD